MFNALRSLDASSTSKRRVLISALTGAVLLANAAGTVAAAVPAGGGAIDSVPLSRPAQQATESAQIRLELLRRHAVEQAARRLERSTGEPLHRFVPTRRPADLTEPRQ